MGQANMDDSAIRAEIQTINQYFPRGNLRIKMY